MDTGLVEATWGIVAATGFLFLAALIPVVRDILSSRHNRENIAATVVPDMNMLWSRISGLEQRLADLSSPTADKLKQHAHNANEQLEMLWRIIEQSGNIGLKFINELYIMRHLLTQVHNSLGHAAKHADKATEEDIRSRDDLVFKSRRACLAAAKSLNAAEALLPDWVRNIEGEAFWDRFARISNEREAEAASEIAAQGIAASAAKRIVRGKI